jgi:hypothetical protein
VKAIESNNVMHRIEGRLEFNIETGIELPWAFIDNDCVTRVKPDFIIFQGFEVVDPSEVLTRRVGIVQEAIGPTGARLASSKRGSLAKLFILWEDGELELRDNYSIEVETINNGLIHLKNGDHLTIFERDLSRKVLFEGNVDLELITEETESDEKEWYEWFVNANPALLVRQSGFSHRNPQKPTPVRKRK